jgi:hypothetical protein
MAFGLGLLVLPLILWRFRGKEPVYAPAQIQQPIHLTFLVASDTHLGLDAPQDPHRNFRKNPVPIEQRNLDMVARMNDIQGTPFPKALGGRVEAPQALLLPGDLTETGEEAQWRIFASIYEQNGTDGRLRLPVYETCGNHDQEKGSCVLDHIRQRHGDTVYAFDLGGVHFISLGEAPDDRGLAFLERDLRTRSATTPLVLFFHLPLLGPWAEQNWFGQGSYRERLRVLLAGRRVLGIFHGHSHIASAYRWNGIDVYNPGSVKHSQRAFLVVEIREDAMTVAAWNLDFGAWWWWHQKPLNLPASKVREAVGIQAPRDFKAQPYFLIEPR